MNKLAVGALVVSTSRFPSKIQPWIHEIYVGEIIQPGSDPKAWNDHNSEQSYCDLMGYAKVCYDWGYNYDNWEDLIEITPEQAALTPIEKVFVFMGEEATEEWLRHSSPREVEGSRELLSRHKKPEGKEEVVTEPLEDFDIDDMIDEIEESDEDLY